MSKPITVVLKLPGEEPRTITIPNTLDELQAIVGGYIEAVDIGGELTLICNEDGRMLGLAPNIALPAYGPFVGVVIVAAANNRGDFVSLPVKRQASVMAMLREQAL